jgi:hypothetical protein
MTSRKRTRNEPDEEETAEETKHDELAAEQIRTLTLPTLRKCLDFHGAELTGFKDDLVLRLVVLGVPYAEVKEFFLLTAVEEERRLLAKRRMKV